MSGLPSRVNAAGDDSLVLFGKSGDPDGPRFRFVDPQSPEEVIFKGEQVQEYGIAPTAQTANYCTCNGVQNKMVCSSDYGDQNGERICNPNDKTNDSPPRGNYNSRDQICITEAEADGARESVVGKP
jgi:hypothetical protein